MLAGLLIVAASRLIDIERIRYTATASWADAVLLVATALAAVFIEVEFAILIGSTISIIWYLLRASKLKVQELIVAPEQVVRARMPGDPPSGDVLIYDLEGEFFFGAAPDLDRYLDEARDRALRQNIRYIVLRLKRVRIRMSLRWSGSIFSCRTPSKTALRSCLLASGRTSSPRWSAWASPSVMPPI